MFCPKCGSNQSEGRKFCTICGTNLQIVSQALTGGHPQSQQAPPAPHPLAIDYKRELEKGITFAIIGGGFLAFKLLNFIFTGAFRRGSFFGFWTFISFIILATGISKIISYRQKSTMPSHPTLTSAPQVQSDAFQPHLQAAPPHPVFSAVPVIDTVTPRTNELDMPQDPAQSVTEDETQHLPRNVPAREIQR